MEIEIKDLMDNYAYYHTFCGNEKNIQAIGNRIKRELSIPNEVPLSFLGILQNILNNEPQYFWNRRVAEEVYNKLKKYHKENSIVLVKSLQSSMNIFFNALNSYEYLLDFYQELHNVDLMDDIKTVIYRNPMYIQICENCLMNFYRVLRNVVNSFSEKDYSSQEKLRSVIQILTKFGFSECVNINVNYRNAINHGKSNVTGDSITFQFFQDREEVYEKIKLYEYDRIIEETFDISTGTLVGFIKFFSTHNEVLLKLLSEEDNETINIEWFKLFYRANNTRVMYADKGGNENTQLNIHTRTSIKEKVNLTGALFQILKGSFYYFPNYEKYFVGYKHNRSLDGWIIVTKEELIEYIEKEKTNEPLPKLENVFINDIKTDEVDERAYRFHVFPKVAGEDWYLSGIKDCSIEAYKRIKANLIIEEKLNKNKIKEIVNNATNKAKGLYTPQNPLTETKYGAIEANMVFLSVFYKAKKRRVFTLLPKNKYFVCLANYYDSNDAPRLKDGGTFDWLWNKFKKEKIENIEFAWNPLYK